MEHSWRASCNTLDLDIFDHTLRRAFMWKVWKKRALFCAALKETNRSVGPQMRQA